MYFFFSIPRSNRARFPSSRPPIDTNHKNDRGRIQKTKEGESKEEIQKKREFEAFETLPRGRGLSRPYQHVQ